MLKVFANDDWIPITQTKDYYIEHEYNGQETLSFCLDESNQMNHLLYEEMSIVEDCKNAYIIKKINKVGKTVNYECKLDLDVFKERLYKDTSTESKLQTKTLSEILNAIMPQGWSIQNASIRNFRRTPELKGATDYDILFACIDIFNVVFRIDTLNKTVIVIDPEAIDDKGLYIHRDLNLLTYSMKGDSSAIVTRIYAEGKDGLTFANINNGKDYVENLEYKKNVISAFWKDDRYTVAENLLEDAKKKLLEISVPKRSYVFNVVDLSSVDKKYSFLSIDMYYPVNVIIDENTSLMSRVVKYREYINDNEKDKNVITLSNEPQTIIQSINNALGGEMSNPLKGSFLEQAKSESTELINAFATKGLKYETENETYYLDKLPKEAAKYVMRMNLGGIAFSTNGWSGPYTTAWTIDGKFNADFISTGTLRAINIIGGSIDIGDSTFTVDEYGRVKLTKGSIDIAGRFVVDENGNLYSEGNAVFNGYISATDGYAGGWQIIPNGFSNGTVIIDKSGNTNIYTWADLGIIQLIILERLNLGGQETAHYDFDGDGKVTSADYVILKNKLMALKPMP